MTDFTAQIKRGASLLDQHFPGWADNIDLDTLDMLFSTTCVLGQASNGRYDEALEDMFGEDSEQDDTHAVAAGFALPDAPGSWAWNWKELTNQWRDFIQNRRNLDALRDMLPVIDLTAADPTDQPFTITPAVSTVTLTREQLVGLVTRAMDVAPARGDYSEVGLVTVWLQEQGF